MSIKSNLTGEHVDTLREKAGDAGITGTSHMRKDQLIAELEEHFSRNTAVDAVALLKKDHAEVKNLFEKALAKEDGDESIVDIVQETIVKLQVHTEIEETIFYPALKNVAQAEDNDDATYEVLEAYVEHDSVKKLMKRILSSSPSDESYKARVQVMSEQVEHHVEEEENEMFEQARRLLGKDELRELGRRMQEMKSQLLQRT